MTDVVVEATDVVVQFGPTRALDGFSCALKRGTTGVLGPNGEALPGLAVVQRIGTETAGR